MFDDYNEYVERVKNYYHYDKITKVMETLLWIMAIILVISLIFRIGILILVCGVGIIFTLMLEWVYIGFVINQC